MRIKIIAAVMKIEQKAEKKRTPRTRVSLKRSRLLFKDILAGAYMLGYNFGVRFKISSIFIPICASPPKAVPSLFFCNRVRPA